MIAVRRLPALLVPAALAAAIVLVGCGGDDGGGGGTDAAPVTGITQIAAKDNKFTPPAIQVPAGTEVTWTFKDRFVPHDVKADGFSSGEPQRSGTFTHTFDQPGTYPYRCTIHDGMTGRVIVTGSS